MRAIVQTKYGTADTLSVREIDRPSIETGEVLVEVRAAGLDRGTWHLMAGLPYAVRLVSGLRAPKRVVAGNDVAGVVVAVGNEVTRFVVGDEVFGIGKGSFAEYAPAREDKLAKKPTKLTFEQAAAMPVSGLTALQGLCDVGRLEAGQKVLIVGASGGVGTYAVQIAKALGAEVTGVSQHQQSRSGPIDRRRQRHRLHTRRLRRRRYPLRPCSRHRRQLGGLTTPTHARSSRHPSHRGRRRWGPMARDRPPTPRSSAVAVRRYSDFGRSSPRRTTSASSGSTSSRRTINSFR